LALELAGALRAWLGATGSHGAPRFATAGGPVGRAPSSDEPADRVGRSVPATAIVGGHEHKGAQPEPAFIRLDHAAILLGAIVAAFLAVVAYNLEVRQPQGRYLFVVLGPTAVLTVAGWRRLAARWGTPPWWPMVLLTLTLAANLYCLVRVVWPVYGQMALHAWGLG
jgi:hypothetical protein